MTVLSVLATKKKYFFSAVAATTVAQTHVNTLLVMTMLRPKYLLFMLHTVNLKAWEKVEFFFLFIFGQQVHETQTGNGVDAKLIESTLKYLLLFFAASMIVKVSVVVLLA